MRILGVTETCDLGAVYLALLAEGHEVKVAISEPLARGTLAGLCPQTSDWRAELGWLREAGDQGLILFESVSEGFGAQQDALRADGFQVIGGSAYGDRLENDRYFAQSLLGELGFPRGHVWSFEETSRGVDFIRGRPRRYVLKYSGADHASSDTYVGRAPDGGDVAALLAARASDDTSRVAPFILMDVIDGVEMGVGAYFNGERFLQPACLDWEHKRFFPGDLGELTGEMGTVVTYSGTNSFFERTLQKLEPHLRRHRHVGYVNLNTIVNEDGIWPLEFSCRFGYPGFAILAPLQRASWSELFKLMLEPASAAFPASPGFCVGVVLTTPPFPYSRKQIAEPIGLPVLIDGPLEPRHFHFGEVGLNPSGQLVTSGLYGWTMVVTGEGPTIEQAKAEAYGRVARVTAPNLRYRSDIGERLIARDLREVARLGLLDP